MYQRILVPVDGSPTSQRGLEEALRLARLTGGRLRLIHVVDQLSFALAMDAYAGDVGDWMEVLRKEGTHVLQNATAATLATGVQVESVLRDNLSRSVQELITAEAAEWGADLMVLGTHGRRGVGRMVLGSSAEQVLRHAPVPVLLVRASDTPLPVPAQDPARHVHLPSAALRIE